MPNCVVLNCKNNNSKGFRLFRLPSAKRNYERRQIWCKLIARPTLCNDTDDTNAAIRVCECHFSDNQFETARMDGKKKLKPNAIPDLLDNKKKRIAETIRVSDNKILKVQDIPHEEDEFIMNDTEYKDSSDTNANVEESDDELLVNEPYENTTKLVEQLKKRLKYTLRKCRYYQRKLEQKNPTNLENIFNQDQLVFLKTDNHRGALWSKDTIIKALKLYMTCGTDGYNEIRRQKLPYPSIRTLQHRLRNLKFKQDILDDKFEVLKLQITL